MKSHGRALLASVLMGAAGLGMAQDKAPETPTQPAPTPSRREGSGTVAKPPRRQVVVGTLVAFDAEKATVTFKDESGKALTWPVEARLAKNAPGYAEQRLQTLKEGDRVQLIYVVDAGGGPRVYDVRPVRAGQPGADRDR
jgi:Cu/Ag efflux protein CusF